MIYLFNQLEELIDVIDEASLAEFTHTIELNQFDRSSFEIPVNYKPNIIKEAQFFGFQSRDRAFCLFRISEKSYDIGLTIEGIDRAESDLHSFIIEDKRPGGTASDVLREILEGTGYQLGNVDGLTRTGRLSFYYISVRQALVKIIESYACEFKTRYTFVENKIIGRYIDLNQRFGRVTGHQFEYGSNILNVTYEESSDDVVTALIGRGKGEESTNESGEATGGYGRRIQFKDVSWSVAKGDPVNKPAGQNYVANETARNIYGLHQNGVIKHRFGVYTNEDIEDPVELLKATYKELQRLSVPIVTFKANLLDLANAIEQDIWIGDSVGIVRDQIGIAFEARIHKLIIDKLDDNRSAVELGDYQTLQAKDRSTRQQAIKDAVSGFSEGLIEEAIANEVDRQNKEFDEKIRVNKLEFDNELQRAKERAEEIKRQISSEIDKKFQSFDNAAINEARRKAEEALRSAGASSLLAQEAKRIGLDSIAKLDEFKRQATSAQTALSGDLDVLKRTVTSEVNQASEYRRTTTEALSRMTGQMNGFATKSEVRQDVAGLTETFAKLKTDTNNLISGAKSEITLAKTEFKKTADALSAKMSAVESYVGQDGQRQDALQRYTREESARQANAIRELVARDYVGKATYQEDVRGLERRFSAISTQTNNDIASKITQYKQTADGQFASITSQIAGKANQSDFQHVRETSQLYERIIGSNENDISNKVARMALTNQLFQIEVSKYSGNGVNRALNTTSDWGPFISRSGGNGVNLHADLHKILSSGFKAGDTVHVRMEISIDDVQRFNDKQIVANLQSYGDVTSWGAGGRPFAYTIGTIQPGNNWRLIEFNTVMTEEMLRNNSWMLNLRVDGAKSYKVHTKSVKVEKGNVASAWSPAPEDTDEAVRSVQSQLAGSWAVQNLTSAGSIVSQINATNNQILIEAEKIRLKGKTLLDELTAFQGYFKRLFVGEGAFAKLNAEIIGSKTITADKLIMDQAMARLFVSSNIFTDALAAKEAFINKLRSVVVTATLLEGFQGLIGGFRFGQYPNRNGYFITGISSVSVGMGNGTNAGANRNAFWANWGESLDTPGPKAWYVNTDGKMYCRNEATFHSKVDFSSISNPNFYSKIKAHKGVWVGTDDVNGEGDNPDGGYNRVVWWSQIVTGKWRQYAGITTASDKKLKENIESTPVRALDKINALNLVAFDYIKDKTHEEIGLIAQEVLNIIPGSVEKYEGEDNHLTINYSKFVPYLIKAIQELNEKIERRTA